MIKHQKRKFRNRIGDFASVHFLWYYQSVNKEEVQQKIIPVLRQYNVLAASVFGSVARGEAGEKSDVDLVVKIGRLPLGIWGFMAFKEELERVLQKKVDVISESALSPKLKSKIERDLTPIYERA